MSNPIDLEAFRKEVRELYKKNPDYPLPEWEWCIAFAITEINEVLEILLRRELRFKRNKVVVEHPTAFLTEVGDAIRMLLASTLGGSWNEHFRPFPKLRTRLCKTSNLGKKITSAVKVLHFLTLAWYGNGGIQDFDDLLYEAFSHIAELLAQEHPDANDISDLFGIALRLSITKQQNKIIEWRNDEPTKV